MNIGVAVKDFSYSIVTHICVCSSLSRRANSGSCKIFTAFYEEAGIFHISVFTRIRHDSYPEPAESNRHRHNLIRKTDFRVLLNIYIHVVIRAILHLWFCRHVRVYKHTYVNTRIYRDVAPRVCLHYRRLCNDISDVSARVGLNRCLASSTFILTNLGSLQMLSAWQWDVKLASPSLAPA